MAFSKPGKAAPRLIQDLLTYDARYEQRAGRNLLTDPPPQHDPDAPPTAAVPYRNCRHNFMIKHEQCELPKSGEDPNHETIYKIASFCQRCRWHADVIVDFRDDGPKKLPCRVSSKDYKLHHFIFQGEDPELVNAYGDPNIPRNFRFKCSAPHCPVDLRIRMYPPRFNEQYVSLLTNKAHLRKRLETARQIAGERADNNVARPVDALDYLSTYLNDAMSPQKGKTRIPLLNRKFLKTFGKDCDQILTYLGFTHDKEIEEDGTEVEVWFLPRPPQARNPLDPETQRTVIEDAQFELVALLLSFPEAERVGIRNAMIQPQPSIRMIERALGCADYPKKPSLGLRSASHEEDHPYFAGLGAVGDFSDELLLFAFARQSAVDPMNAAYYFECLQDIAIGRKSEYLETKVVELVSNGHRNRREVEEAYRYFDIRPAHANVITDEHILGRFKARLQDIGPTAVVETRNMLRTIGFARGSEKIKQEASNAIETYDQAMSWLDLDDGQPDDFVVTMYALKVNENPADREIANKAVSVVAKHRNSARLRHFLDTGVLEGQMDEAEAYALLDIQDRAGPIDLESLQVTVGLYITDRPHNKGKYEQAYNIICRDQKVTGGFSDDMRNTKPKYPLDSWPVGCLNIGNTCYLNSVLQFLFTVKPLRYMVLNCEDYFQAITPEALEAKKVGRSAVTAEKVAKAQQFVQELRNLFRRMITANTDRVRPEPKLAALALARPDDVTSKSVQNNTSTFIGPMPNPQASSEPTPNQPAEAKGVSMADSVMGDDAMVGSDTSSTIAEVDTEEINNVAEITGPTANPSVEASSKPEPPSRPPPVPPRPQDMSQIENWANQQDAAEILNNVFDLLSSAIRGRGTLRDGEQRDMIKELFFSDITAVRLSDGVVTRNSALQDNHLISPGNRNRPLYAALDDEFSMTEIEPDNKGGKSTNTTKYEYMEQASPIQIINVRRLVFEGGTSKKDESLIGLDTVLYLDRYLNKTKSLSEVQLQERREKQWQLRRRLKVLESRKAQLQETELKIALPEAVEETASYIEELDKPNDEKLVDVEDDPVPTFPELAGHLKDHAHKLRKEAEILDAEMTEIDQEIESIFADCKDHPYRLHAVFMHRGNAKGGHYLIYIYDFQNDLWREYNDEHVNQVEASKVFQQEQKYSGTSTGVVYVREDLVEEFTEAVRREPDPPVVETDVEMKDSNSGDYQDVQVIDGIETASLDVNHEADSEPVAEIHLSDREEL